MSLVCCYGLVNVIVSSGRNDMSVYTMVATQSIPWLTQALGSYVQGRRYMYLHIYIYVYKSHTYVFIWV